MSGKISSVLRHLLTQTAYLVARLRNPSRLPFLCVITPVFDGALPSLRLLIKDLQSQTQGDFIHVCVSNGSSPKVKKYLHDLAASDSRFRYVQTKPQQTRTYAELLANLGFRRNYALKKFEAKRYVFFDADLKLTAPTYFNKLFVVDSLTPFAVTVAKIMHTGRVAKFPVDFDMASFSFSRATADAHPYPTDLDPQYGRGNDYRYFKSIRTRLNTIFLPVVFAIKDGNKSYLRVSDRYLQEKIGSSMISVFGNSFTARDEFRLKNVLESHLVGRGEHVKEFEDKYKTLVGFKYGVATNSCTNGFWLLFKALHLRQTQKVLLPNIHFFGIQNVLKLHDIKYSVLDVGEGIPNLTLSSVKAGLTKNTAAIIFLEYAGYPTEVKAIKKYLDSVGRSDVLLILDAANSPLTKVNGSYSARDYDFAIYSFDMNKILVTGDGGLILSDHAEMMTKIRRLAFLGVDPESGYSKAASGEQYWWQYHVDEPSIMCSMNNLAASLGITQLEQSNKFLTTRQWLKNYYDELLRPLALRKLLTIPPVLKNVSQNVYLYFIRLNDQTTRDDLAKYLLARNIYTTLKYPCLVENAGTKNAQNFAATALCLPLHQNLESAHITYIVESINQFFQGHQ